MIGTYKHKVKLYNRVCNRCGGAYKTTARKSRVCEKCYYKRGNII